MDSYCSTETFSGEKVLSETLPVKVPAFDFSKIRLKTKIRENLTARNSRLRMKTLNDVGTIHDKRRSRNHLEENSESTGKTTQLTEAQTKSIFFAGKNSHL